MKYLHIIPPSVRMMTTYVTFIEENFNTGEPDADQHDFVSIRPVPKGEMELFSEDNRFWIEGTGLSKLKNLRKLIKNYDYVLWYSFIVPHRYALFLSIHPLIRKKSSWVVWGMDLHNWELPNTSLKNRIKNWAHRKARKGFDTVICLEEDDRTKYREEFNNANNCIRARLPMNKDSFRELESMRQAAPRKNGKTFIQVEHNSHSFNNHIPILESLQAVDNEKFEYWLPLAYGTANDWEGNPGDYRDRVIELADEMYGERSHVLLSMMPIDTYTRMLWNMDIAIFGSDRQNGLGNILRLLYVGNKVFLPRENPTYKRLKSLGCEISATEDIKNMSVDEFLKPASPESQQKTCDWIMEAYYPDNLAHMWSHVFKVISHQESVEQYDAVAYSGGFVVKRPEPFENFPRQKEGWLNLKPYIWPGHHRTVCSHVYIIGSGQRAYSMINSAAHMRSKMYVRGFLCDIESSTNALDEQFYCGSTSYHFPFATNDRFLFAETDRQQKERDFNLLLAESEAMKQMASELYEDVEALDDEEAKPFNPDDYGLDLSPLISHSAMLGLNVEVDDGSYIAQDCFINAGTTIGKGCYIGNKTIIGTNCAIEDFCTIEEDVLIGDNVVIETGVTLCAGAAIESGAVVTKDSVVAFKSIVRKAN